MQAEPARAARRNECGDDVIAGLDLGDLVADLHHGAGALVPENRAGHDARHVTVLQRKVGVADAARAELDDDVAGAGG